MGEIETSLPLPFYVKEADAIVSTGSFRRKVSLPAPSKVIGCAKGQVVFDRERNDINPWEELTSVPLTQTGGVDYHGNMRNTISQH